MILRSALPSRWPARRRGGAARRLAAGILLAASLGASLLHAEPPADGVEVFSEPGFAGIGTAATLAPGESQKVVGVATATGSVRLGEGVCLLLSRSHRGSRRPICAVLTRSVASLSADWHSSDVHVLFRKGKPRGRFGLGHPDGVVFRERQGRTVVGGTSPEDPAEYFPPGTDTPFAWLHGRDMPWIEVYGPATWVRLRDRDGGEHVFTTGGKEVAEHYLGNRLPDLPIVHLSVGVGVGKTASPFSTAPPADLRARWAHPQATFRLAADGRWVEVSGGGAPRLFQEVARTPAHVEILDAGRGIRLRLATGGALIQDASGAYVVFYAGGGWTDARDFWRAGPTRWFRLAGGTRWEEQQGGRTAFTFAETLRTAEFVEIADASRGVAVRLHADRATILRKDDPTATWAALGPGRWEREPSAAAATSPAPPAVPPPVPSPVPPGAPAIPDLSGPWANELGVVYHFQQSGSAFTWSVGLTGERAEGHLSAPDSLSVRWQGPLGSGSATGRVTQRDGLGRPLRIQWSNGVVFRRK